MPPVMVMVWVWCWLDCWLCWRFRARVRWQRCCVVGLWLVCGVVGPSALLADVPVCYSPPLLAGVCCRWWCVVPHHSWLGSAGGGGVRCVVCGVWCVVCGVRRWCADGVVAGVCCGWSLATPCGGSLCYSPPLLAGFRCRRWWAFLATPVFDLILGSFLYFMCSTRQLTVKCLEICELWYVAYMSANASVLYLTICQITWSLWLGTRGLTKLGLKLMSCLVKHVMYITGGVSEPMMGCSWAWTFGLYHPCILLSGLTHAWSI